MMLGGGGAERTSFTITPQEYEITPYDTLQFKVDYENAIANTTVFWHITSETLDDFFIVNPEGEQTLEEEEGTFWVDVRFNTSDGARESLDYLTLRFSEDTAHVKLFAGVGEAVIRYTRKPSGEQLFLGIGDHDWVVPEGVEEVFAVAVGGGAGGSSEFFGAGGDGGALRWRQRVPVVPGETLRVTVGKGGANVPGYVDRQGGLSGLFRGDEGLLVAAGGGMSSSVSTPTVFKRREASGDLAAYTYLSKPYPDDMVGGGDGGRGAAGGAGIGPGGGGGAGGFMGRGGDGGNQNEYFRWSYYNRDESRWQMVLGGFPCDAYSGGGGGGSYYYIEENNSYHATPGGGVGILEIGRDGLPGIRNMANRGGQGGSGGENSDWTAAGNLGGGGRGSSSIQNYFPAGETGGDGGVRLIWGFNAVPLGSQHYLPEYWPEKITQERDGKYRRGGGSGAYE